MKTSNFLLGNFLFIIFFYFFIFFIFFIFIFIFIYFYLFFYFLFLFFYLFLFIFFYIFFFLKIIDRTEAVAESNLGEETEMVTIHALNEFDPKTTQWRQKLDGQRGGVFAKELLNNSSKISKWASEAYLSECSRVLLGFVGRNKERDNQDHTILGTQYYKVTDLFRQLGMKVSQMWAIVKVFIDACMEQEDGDYVIVKDPAENKMILYRDNPNSEN